MEKGGSEGSRGLGGLGAAGVLLEIVKNLGRSFNITELVRNKLGTLNRPLWKIGGI